MESAGPRCGVRGNNFILLKKNSFISFNRGVGYAYWLLETFLDNGRSSRRKRSKHQVWARPEMCWFSWKSYAGTLLDGGVKRDTSTWTIWTTCSTPKRDWCMGETFLDLMTWRGAEMGSVLADSWGAEQRGKVNKRDIPQPSGTRWQPFATGVATAGFQPPETNENQQLVSSRL